MRPVIIVSTFPSKQSVTSIANRLVKKKLAACVNITKISSVYTWKGKIENQPEYLAFFKTTKKNKQILKKELEKLHPYDVPEIAEINNMHIYTVETQNREITISTSKSVAKMAFCKVRARECEVSVFKKTWNCNETLLYKGFVPFSIRT